jgi:hypothetical protein
MPVVNRKEFAEFVGYTPRHVGNWLDEGMPCRRSGKKGDEVEIDSGDAIRWLLERRAGEDGQSATDRLRVAQAEKAEFENRVRAGEFIPAELHDAVIGHVASEIAQQMAALPGRVAGVLSGINEPALVRARMIQECNGVRDAVANHMDGLAGALEALAAEPAEVGTIGAVAGDHDAGPVGEGESEAAEG